MNFPRRRFLGSSLLVFGSTLLDALSTPLWKWNRSLAISAQPASPESPVQFVNVAREAGLTVPNVWGGMDHKRYIIEAKGSGIAFFDYDQDGWLDIYHRRQGFSSQARDIRSPQSAQISTMMAGQTSMSPWIQNPAFSSATIMTGPSPTLP
jgi:hypothetical protein